jgi:hypothetical protein
MVSVSDAGAFTSHRLRRPMLLEELVTALSTLVGDLWDALLRRIFPRR